MSSIEMGQLEGHIKMPGMWEDLFAFICMASSLQILWKSFLFWLRCQHNVRIEYRLYRVEKAEALQSLQIEDRNGSEWKSA